MEPLTLELLIEQIQSKDDNIRAGARDSAGVVGAKAIRPLAKIATTGELEIARAANRAIQNIVYFAGRPGAKGEAEAVAAELITLVADASRPVQFRRDLLWMTWQIAGDEAVAPIAALFANDDLREDARLALERLPGEKATAALKKGLDAAAGKEKSAFAHSLHVRGVDVPGIPDLRLVPTKQTSVQPVGR